MKYILKKVLKSYLKFWAKVALFIHKPYIIAIAGSTNKSIIKDEINRILRSRGNDVRSNIKSFNTEIGLPLAILSLPSGYGSYSNWITAIKKAPLEALKKDFPRCLVLELGVSRPGDMRELLKIIKPNIAVISNITQRYLESFDDMDELVEEFELLAKNILPGGFVIVNSDNQRLKVIAKNSDKQNRTFGFIEGADCLALSREEHGIIQDVKIRLGNEEFVRKVRRPGKHHVYALLVGMLIEKYYTE
jgi:UDP-N-acetylmuramoyl-tripeptide--D-alanyl-D-alanine ligase